MNRVSFCDRFRNEVKFMSISLERQDEGYPAMPRGGVYDLVSAALYGADSAIRLRAVVALGKSDDPRAVRPLAELLSDADDTIRLSATTALGQLKSGRPVEELIGRLRDRDERVAIREQAAFALLAIRSTGAIRGLRDFVEDQQESPAIRSFAESLLKETCPL
jgi:HEAT repeat protein